MKNNIKTLAVVVFASAFAGCATSWRLPSVTVGGSANKDSVLDAKAGKSGVSVTVPLLNVDVPFPTVETGKDVK